MRKTIIGAALSLTMAISLMPAAAFAATDGKATVERVAGSDASRTSIAVSQATFEDNSSKSVVIARYDDFADAMSATGLAGTLKCPIITTDSSTLSPAVLKEVSRVGATKAYLIGGPYALSSRFEGVLKDNAVDSERVYGATAWDTSVKCAEKITALGGNPEGKAIITTSKTFQDALSISSYAYKQKIPIYLLDQEDSLDSTAKGQITALSGGIIVPGGPYAVPYQAAESAFPGKSIDRIYGENAYDTSNAVATALISNYKMSPETVVVASGAEPLKGADALAGSALAGINNGVVLLVNGNPEMGPVNLSTIKGKDTNGNRAFVTKNAASIEAAYLLGGGMAMPSDVLTQVNMLVNAPNNTNRND